MVARAPGRRKRSRLLRRAHRERWPYPGTYVGGNDVTVFSEGGPCYDAMLAAIEAAEHTVHLETYILQSDGVGWRFARALAKRARAGIEVALMYDAIGALSLSAEFLEHLAQAGVKVLAYHPIWPWKPGWNLFRRNHRKILVVDGSFGFVGGMNISDQHAPVADGGENWRDTHLSIVGPAALPLQRLFIEEWVRQGGPPLTERAGVPAAERGVAVRVVENRSMVRRALVRAAYRDALRYARRRIWITNSYFVPDRRFRRALLAAARRGVDVRVLVAGRSDVPLVMWASQHLYTRMLRSGIRVFEWTRTVLHAKTAVVDSKWSTIGTYNLDRRSLAYNLEVNAMILDESVAGALEALFERDIEASTEILLESWQTRGLGTRLKEWLAFQLRRWL